MNRNNQLAPSGAHKQTALRLVLTGAALLAAIWMAPAQAQAQMPPPLDVNSAPAEAIAKVMRGVGLKVATRIVKFREKHGPFPTVEALIEVRGIGKRLLQRNREAITAKPAKKARM